MVPARTLPLLFVVVSCVGSDPALSSSGGTSPDAGSTPDGSGANDGGPTADGGDTPRGGVIDTAFSGTKDVRFEELTGITADATGRVYVLGHRRQCVAGGRGDAAVARLDATGAVDTGFGAQGRACINTWVNAANEDFDDDSGAIAIDETGRVVVAGSSHDPSGQSGTRLFIARLTDAGALDPTFNGGRGFSRLGALPEGTVTSIVVDGSTIWLAGRGKPNGGLVVKLDANGTPDATFGTNGAMLDTAVDRYTSLAVSKAGVFVGVATGSAFAVRKIGDASFGAGGTATIDVSPAFDEARSVAIDASGRIVVAGVAAAASAGQPGRVAAVRLLPTGAPDPTFPTFSSGAVVWPTATQARGWVQADGKVLLPAIVPTGRDFAVVRLDADGKPDATYGNGGTAAGTDARDDVTLAIAPDAKSGGTLVLADANDAVTENFSNITLTFRRPVVYRLSR